MVEDNLRNLGLVISQHSITFQPARNSATLPVRYTPQRWRNCSSKAEFSRLEGRGPAVIDDDDRFSGSMAGHHKRSKHPKIVSAAPIDRGRCDERHTSIPCLPIRRHHHHRFSLSPPLLQQRQRLAAAAISHLIDLHQPSARSVVSAPVALHLCIASLHSRSESNLRFPRPC